MIKTILDYANGIAVLFGLLAFMLLTSDLMWRGEWRQACILVAVFVGCAAITYVLRRIWRFMTRPMSNGAA